MLVCQGRQEVSAKAGASEVRHEETAGIDCIERQPERTGEGCGYNQGHMQKTWASQRDKALILGVVLGKAGSLQKLSFLL